MNRKVLTIIALQAFIIVVLFWVLVFYGQDEYEAYLQEEQEEEIAGESLVDTENGITTIQLNEAAQQHSGIATTRLATAAHRATMSGVGTVVAIDGLVALRGEYLAALAEGDVIRAALPALQQDYERLSALNKDERNVSDRAVAEAKTAWQTEQAKLSAMQNRAAAVRDNIRQQWGDTLTYWATQREPHPTLQRLISHQESLLRLTLPEQAGDPKPSGTLTLMPAVGAPSGITAYYVAAAQQADAAIPGRTFYYRADATHLRSDMRVTARLRDQHAATGIIVPHAAVVWYGGRAWAYVRENAAEFVRTPVSTDIEAEDGWFNTEGFEAGDSVVTSGAQLLLSEEFKYQIKNENED